MARREAYVESMRTLSGELREELGGVDIHMVRRLTAGGQRLVWESLGDDELRLRL